MGPTLAGQIYSWFELILTLLAFLAVSGIFGTSLGFIVGGIGAICRHYSDWK